MLLNYITWDVDPELFPVGPLSIRWYGLLFAAAFYFSYLIVRKMFKKEGVSDEVLDRLTLYVFIGTVVGARLGHCLFYEPDYYLSNPVEIFKIWKGGLASHGGAIGILIALYLFVKKEKRPYIWILDRIAVVAAISGFFIRMGNLFNSEIYGYETDLPWGFVFVKAGETVPKHPTQIYEALAYILIFALLYYLYNAARKGNVRPGLLFGWFLVLVFTARFFIEYLKEVQVEAEKTMTLKLGQSLSLPFIIAGIIILYFSYKNPKKLDKKYKPEQK
jgi:prolipoprotein diacylglyceryl transferase